MEGRLSIGLAATTAVPYAACLNGTGWQRFSSGGVRATWVIGRTPAFPFDGSFMLGVGRHFVSGGGQTHVPLGLSVGRRLSLDGQALQVTPYVQPTVVIADDALFTFGLGIDLRIRGIPEIRFNTAVGDMDGFSVSLFWAR